MIQREEMRVLLLSYNHTVQEMVALALREEEVELVVAQAADQVEPTNYDLVLVDDLSTAYEESIALLRALGVDAIVLLAQAGNMKAEDFGRVLRKPFLPSDIQALVASRRGELEADPSLSVKAKKKKKKKKKQKNQSKTAPATEVLDPDEIEMIKTLLQEEGLEIVEETELAEQVITATTDEEPARHEALLKALRKMKPKKIRKLLKGATVRIEITFPDASR